MVIEIGHYAFWLAAILSSLAPPAILLLKNISYRFDILKRAFSIICALTLISFLSLFWAYITTDLSTVNVVLNSHSLKPLLYKVSGVWGNHEGSLMLWCLILAVMGMCLARHKTPEEPRMQIAALICMALIFAGFAFFVLLASSPFARLFPPPLDGQDLNPLLQDPALAFHPPLLYLGYVGMAPVFALAVAGLWTGRIDAAWAAQVRPYILFAWTSLSAGIALGSWWAYYELGWGGWWFWDPVENASLLPWLLATALLHSVIVLEKRGLLARWTLLLALLSFTLSLLGTFLVRSGVLTSVHAFALDPGRGVFLLILLALYAGAGFALYAWRAPTLRTAQDHQSDYALLSRENSLLLNNLLLSVIAAIIMTGTLYPLINEALGGAPLSVGPPYFNATTLPLALPLLLLMGAGPYIAWKQAKPKRLMRALILPLVLTAGGLTALALHYEKGMLALVFTGAGLWVITATLAHFAKGWRPEAPTAANFKHLRWGLGLAHLGLGVAVIGMVGTSLYKEEQAAVMQTGDRMEIAGYDIALTEVRPVFGPNYSAVQAVLDVYRINAPFAPVTTLRPEIRSFPVAQDSTTEAGITTFARGDVYAVLGGADAESGGWLIRVTVHPVVGALWAGFALMVAGGMMALLPFPAPRKKA